MLTFFLAEARERLVEQQYLWLLRQRHRHFEPASLAVRGFRDGALGAGAKADQRERLACRIIEMALPGEKRPNVPAHLAEAEQRQHDVVAEGFLGKQRKNLIGPREAEMHALLCRQLEQFLP